MPLVKHESGQQSNWRDKTETHVARDTLTAPSRRDQSSRSHKHEAMSGNNRSFCDSHSRKHFNIKQVLRALCIIRESRQAGSALPTPGLHVSYDSANVIPSCCPAVFLFHSGSPSSTSTFTQHLFCVSFMTAFGHTWSSKFPFETSRYGKAKHTDVRTICHQLPMQGSILLMEILASNMAAYC